MPIAKASFNIRSRRFQSAFNTLGSLEASDGVAGSAAAMLPASSSLNQPVSSLAEPAGGSVAAAGACEKLFSQGEMYFCSEWRPSMYLGKENSKFGIISTIKKNLINVNIRVTISPHHWVML